MQNIGLDYCIDLQAEQQRQWCSTGTHVTLRRWASTALGNSHGPPHSSTSPTTLHSPRGSARTRYLNNFPRTQEMVYRERGCRWYLVGSEALPFPVVGSEWLLLFPVGLGWSLLFPDGLWIAAVISWWVLDGCWWLQLGRH